MFPPMIMRGLLLALLLVPAMAGPAAAAGFTFGAFGDAPYNTDEESQFIGVLAAMNREPLAFAIHVGDFKSGTSACDDELFAQRLAWFGLMHHPLVYVPGDNEWTDCWRALDSAHAPMERLQKLRAMYFARAESLGQRRMPVARQSDSGPPYPEHLRWMHDGVVFVTLNVPGSANNAARMPEEAARRTTAAIAWLREAFEAAAARRSPAIVVVMHANPWARNGRVRASYASLMNDMSAFTAGFAGEVVLIHGDTHHYRVDRPLRLPGGRDVAGNFTRIEVHGSPFVDWVRVRVDLGGKRARVSALPGSDAPAP